jgi:2-polyprenyl-3-methyl-5-hydroxy-6-metoxy-1,4-benzoquinol methylase
MTLPSSTAAHICIVCGSPDGEVWVERAPDYITGTEFSVLRCLGCGLARTEPQPASLDRYYPGRYRQYGGLTFKVLRALYGWRVRGWMRHLPKQGRALEIGCGDGWMLAILRDNGWRVVGSERSMAGARAAVARNNIPMFVGDVNAIAKSRFDLIILFQVLEHLADPISTLRQSAALLEPGGVMIVAVPNASSWQARAFGRSWFHLDVPRHQHHFSADALGRAFQKAELKVVRTRMVSPEHDPYGVLQSILNWLGFRQNLLTKLLMGMSEKDVSVPAVTAMAVLAGLLALPSAAISIVSWGFGSGAIVEVWAAKA